MEEGAPLGATTPLVPTLQLQSPATTNHYDLRPHFAFICNTLTSTSTSANHVPPLSRAIAPIAEGAHTWLRLLAAVLHHVAHGGRGEGTSSVMMQGSPPYGDVWSVTCAVVLTLAAHAAPQEGEKLVTG